MAARKQPEIDVPFMSRPPGGGVPGNIGMARFAPREKARDARGTFRRLLGFYLKEGKSLFLVLVMLLIDTAAVVSAPYFIGRAVSAMTDGVRLELVSVYALVLIIVYVLSWILNIVQGVIMNKTSQRIVRGLRKALFDKLQSLPLTYHDTHAHGDLMSRLTNDVDNISVTIAQSTTQLAGAGVTVVGSIVMMALLNAYLTLAALITIPLVVLLTRFVAKRSRRMFADQQDELGALNATIEETIAGQKMVKAFNMEEKVTKKFSETNGRLRHHSVRAQIWSGLLMPFMNVITNLGYVCVAAVGGVLAVNGMISIGAIASFTTYSRQFTFPLNNIAGMFNSLQSALAGAERVFELLDEQDEAPDAPGAVDIGEPKGDVRFENVTFAYVPGVNVLKGVSFTVKAGEKVALVGPTGAGKTTIVNLLTRFYDATEGTVYIDGIDIRQYRRDSLSHAFSVVLQDTCLFTGTIADNIRYARPNATDEQVVEAAKAADADAFIRRLRDGYDTLVSGETDSLSQGQRQLLAISRAVLCRAPILILDEATSSVDTRTELHIQRAVLRLSAGRTSFVIAHRLSTIRDADIIMVVQDGQIVESGSHGELLAKSGAYAKMYRSQFDAPVQ